MSERVTFKTIPLPLSDLRGLKRERVAEHEARVQAHCERIHPILEALEREEARIEAIANANPIAKWRTDYRKYRRKAMERAGRIAARSR